MGGWFTRYPSGPVLGAWYTEDGRTYTLDDLVAGMDPFRDRTRWLSRIGQTDVSTVFLAMDHSRGGPYAVLWETMLFGPLDPDQLIQVRYETKAGALAGHILTCLWALRMDTRADLASGA